MCVVGPPPPGAMSTRDLPIDLAGERVVLLPERAMYWPRERTLLVADPHWGKAAAFRAHGVAIPGGTTSAGLARLDRVIDRTGTRRVVFLGDYLHAQEGRAPATLGALAKWSDRRRGIDLVLVRGNHDRAAGDPPPALRIRAMDPPLDVPPFRFAHHPSTGPGVYVVAGHIHPVVRIRGPGRQSERLPCFHFTAETGVLPAFGEFTGGAEIVPTPGDRVFVVAGSAVLELGG